MLKAQANGRSLLVELTKSDALELIARRSDWRKLRALVRWTLKLHWAGRVPRKETIEQLAEMFEGFSSGSLTIPADLPFSLWHRAPKLARGEKLTDAEELDPKEGAEL